MRLGRCQRELLVRIRDHGHAIPVIRTQRDVDVFRSLERRGLVRTYVATRSASLHTATHDATELTPAGRAALRPR